MSNPPVDLDRMLHDLVQQIVAIVHPRRIILFGSAACGQMHAGSDVDILIVMPDGVHRRQTAQHLYRDLPAFGIAKDLIVVTESDIERYGDNPSLVLYPALREGKELYAAKG